MNPNPGRLPSACFLHMPETVAFDGECVWVRGFAHVRAIQADDSRLHVY